MATRIAARAASIPHTSVMVLPSDPAELERAMRGVLARRERAIISDDDFHASLKKGDGK